MTSFGNLRAALINRRMLICIFTGFSSGLPLYILINLIPAWLRSEHVDLKAIGLFALIQLPFTWKFVWSPLLDRYAIPLLGRRRGWMLITQLLLLVSIPLFGALNPQLNLWTIAYLATAVAFFSATHSPRTPRPVICPVPAPSSPCAKPPTTTAASERRSRRRRSRSANRSPHGRQSS